MPPEFNPGRVRENVETAKNMVRQGDWTSADLQKVEENLPGGEAAVRALRNARRAKVREVLAELEAVQDRDEERRALWESERALRAELAAVQAELAKFVPAGITRLAELTERMDRHLRTMPPEFNPGRVRENVETAKNMVWQGNWISADLQKVKESLSGAEAATVQRTLRRLRPTQIRPLLHWRCSRRRYTSRNTSRGLRQTGQVPTSNSLRRRRHPRRVHRQPRRCCFRRRRALRQVRVFSSLSTLGYSAYFLPFSPFLFPAANQARPAAPKSAAPASPTPPTSQSQRRRPSSSREASHRFSWFAASASRPSTGASPAPPPPPRLLQPRLPILVQIGQRCRSPPLPS